MPTNELVREFFGTTAPDVKFVIGKGCERCQFVGYRGRALVAELWIPDQHDHLLIMRNSPFEELRLSAARTTITMAECAHSHLTDQRTTLEELARVLPYPAIVEHRERAMARTKK